MPGPASPLVAIVDFAEVGDIAGTPSVPRRQFRDPARVIRADHVEEVLPAIAEAERLAHQGHWVVGYVGHEASAAFDPAFAAASSVALALPLAWFAAFAEPEERAGSGPPGEADREATGSARGASIRSALDPSTDVSEHEYSAGIERIRAYIRAGDVYQVNLTVPFTAASATSARELYESMRRAQGGRYSAFLDLGDAQVMSASPELFFERAGELLRSRPMKGTSARAPSAAADLQARTDLLRSEKDRAENVMIVDVVRNDLGRVARVGTVRVAALCEAERYPTVWQLTSTVEAAVTPDVSLGDLFRALFPPASITGAPKIRATAIIRELETQPREVYCGAVGVIRPGGDAQFNVAIRTAWSRDGGRTLRLSAGGGVTIDSTPAGELWEVRAKLAAFTTERRSPALFETLRVEAGVAVRQNRHLARLGESAAYFGYPFDTSAAAAMLASIGSKGHDAEVCRARLVLEPDGELRLTVQPFTDAAPAAAVASTARPAGDSVTVRAASFGSPPVASGGARPVALATTPVNRDDLLLYHKSVVRDVYDAARAASPESFDVLLWNAEREITEFTRGNVVVELDGARWTPPVDCGLLAGVLRAELLELGVIGERVIHADELPGAERVWFVNALRGWVEVRVVGW